ncbi:MAG: proton-conducting transporter membrane subunit [Saprospiraceae bacterium]|nr:proton-conducting transporter membrane subunit [Saprospiraceae bacterium]
MNQYLSCFILLPLGGWLLSVLLPGRNEKMIFGVSVATVGLQLAALAILTGAWSMAQFPVLFFEGPVLYETHDSHFSIDFYFDRVTAVYGIVAAVLTLLVLIFSRYYMHRDRGYKRYFNNMMFFFAGLKIVLFAGNFETLFIGWEILGVTSFFLIAYYRDRYLPVKNALKVVSLYRVADVALLIGIWLMHHAFERNVNFADFLNGAVTDPNFTEHSVYPVLVPAIFLLAAVVKSAQFPLSSWLPRAMEGPTTSSAIFYGSLSVHIGVFLLLRTYPIWEASWVFKTVVVVIGLLTALTAGVTARVQSTVKTQIAYASVAQIGLMFVEVALGWHTLALVHFAANAFLRTYQLLVSPSVLSYLIHDQFFYFKKPALKNLHSFWNKIRASAYVLGIKEWNLDAFMRHFLWDPLKWAGNHLQFLNLRMLGFVFLPLVLCGFYFVYNRSLLPEPVLGYLPSAMAVLGTLMALKAFAERGSAYNALALVVMNQLFSALSIGLNAEFEYRQIHLFLSGIVVSALVGFYCLWRLDQWRASVQLDRFHGHSFYYPGLAFAFVLACLGLSGFPITPTFIGEDLLLGNIDEHQFFLLGFTALSLILDGLAVFRIYARLFLGPNLNGYHEVAYKSS